ncbi:hypothetical protein [Streptomyces sp. G-G2]|uniref:hypothetical protein n=1 Tax=Streptomyces sp. G-G2 TaxID=3046201 RepID=UPI0024B89874|nr:hypothetical protein [Streptomyces sp. G-G2]MDJ0379774.1 hypothetical protein [Streptomyces sp. G-G2]
MDNGLIALAAAVVGVAGTLLATALSQRMLARVQAAQFERQQQSAHAQWLRERDVTELARRRDCYIAAGAAFRRYRISLMTFLWLVRDDEVTPAERAALDEARHAHHAAFAEAQMVAAGDVLAELDALTETLAGVYSRTLRLGSPDPDGSFEDVRAELLELRAGWETVRRVMRADLGADADPAARALSGGGRR